MERWKTSSWWLLMEQAQPVRRRRAGRVSGPRVRWARARARRRIYETQELGVQAARNCLSCRPRCTSALLLSKRRGSEAARQSGCDGGSLGQEHPTSEGGRNKVVGRQRGGGGGREGAMKKKRQSSSGSSGVEQTCVR